MKKILLMLLFTLIAIPASAAGMLPLPEAYQAGHIIRVLIVPGHDNEFSGSSGNGLREADLNLKLAHQIADLLRNDQKFDVTVSRDLVTGDYIPELSNYFETKRDRVENFIMSSKKLYALHNRKTSSDESEPKQVPHGDAKAEVAYRLYATNLWAAEENYDLLLHVHFNDTYPRGGSGGEYSGYSIYTPGSPLPNQYPSDMIANAIGKRLNRILPASNLNLESELANDVGVIPDTKLIALGSFGTLEIPSVLVEYSYIYEPLVNPEVSRAVLPQMARATMLGLYDYLLDQTGAAQPIAYQWNETLRPDTQIKKPDVIALQMVLRFLGFYPPSGKTRQDCPMTGAYGPCTKSAVTAFQKANNLEADGIMGPASRALLNQWFPK